VISLRPRLLIVVLFFSVLFVGKSHAQSPQAPQGPQVHFPAHNPGEQPPDEMDKDMEKARLKRANDARQAQIKQDTDKLLILATQLKEYVDKTNADILSLDVVKKADEIEKLAHSVKEKMKD
jgi:type VI protein secretion system component VasF